MRGKAQRRVIAVWFGMIALVLQAELPLLVAIDVSFANRAAAYTALDICGYRHRADPGHGASHPPLKGDGLCRICVALYTGPVFTAPATLPLPVPAGRAIAASVPEMRSAPHRISLSAYRSRAPPIG